VLFVFDEGDEGGWFAHTLDSRLNRQIERYKNEIPG
jgi:hypothetical protein